MPQSWDNGGWNDDPPQADYGILSIYNSIVKTMTPFTQQASLPKPIFPKFQTNDPSTVVPEGIMT